MRADSARRQYPLARQGPAGTVENGIHLRLDSFPTFVAAAGNPNIIDELKKGKDLNGTTYKVHIDGVDQTDMITEKGPSKHTEKAQIMEAIQKNAGK